MGRGPSRSDEVLASRTELFASCSCAQARASWSELGVLVLEKKMACHTLVRKCRWSTGLFFPDVHVVVKTVRFQLRRRERVVYRHRRRRGLRCFPLDVSACVVRVWRCELFVLMCVWRPCVHLFFVSLFALKTKWCLP